MVDGGRGGSETVISVGGSGGRAGWRRWIIAFLEVDRGCGETSARDRKFIRKPSPDGVRVAALGREARPEEDAAFVGEIEVQEARRVEAFATQASTARDLRVPDDLASLA